MRLYRKTFSKKEKSKDTIKSGLLIGGGSLSIVPGVNLLDNVYRNGEVSGRVHLYHGTSKKAKESILKEGLKGKYALDPNSPTNKALKSTGIKDGRKLVYLGKKRFPAYKLAKIRKTKFKEDPAMVKINIPYDEYKNMKRVYNNPEFLNESKEEWVSKRKTGNIKRDYKLRKYYDDFSGNRGTSGTRIFEQDIDTKRIKGSKNYIKNSPKELIDYVKNNPKRFAKGIAKTAAGVGLVSGGAYMISKGIKPVISNND